MREPCACPAPASAPQVQLIEQLIPRLTARPGEQSRLRTAKQTLKLTKLAPELSSLMRWLAGGYVGFNLLPQSLQQFAPTMCDANGWSVGRPLLQLRCLWCAAVAPLLLLPLPLFCERFT